MRRHIIGALGLLGLSVAAWSLISGGYAGLNSPMPSLALRLGIVLSAIWLGMPDLNKLFAKYPPWVLVLALGMVVAIVANPRFLPLLIGILVLVAIVHFGSRVVQPRKKTRGGSNPESHDSKSAQD